jgi:hypothetical protein
MNKSIKITQFNVNEMDDVYLVVIKLEVDQHSHYWESCLGYSTDGVSPLMFDNESGAFLFDKTISVCPATKGILAALKQLQESNNFGDTTIDCNIIRCLRALDLFWN